VQAVTNFDLATLNKLNGLKCRLPAASSFEFKSPDLGENDKHTFELPDKLIDPQEQLEEQPNTKVPS
jgi:hypothetical protein